MPEFSNCIDNSSSVARMRAKQKHNQRWRVRVREREKKKRLSFCFFYNLPDKLDNLLGKLDLAIAYFLAITYREESSLIF